MDQIGVGMMAAEIGQRRAVLHGAGREAEALFQDFGGIRAGDGAHRVERHGEAALDRALDRGEVEQALHQRGIVGDRIDDLDRHAAHRHLAQRIEVDVIGLDGQPAADRLGVGVNRIGHLFRRGAAVRDVVLDAEVFVRAARVVTGRQDQAAQRLALADHVAGRRGGQDAALTDHHTGKAVRRRHADRDLDHLAVQEAAVPADHQRLAGLFVTQRIEHRLDEVLGIMGLLKDADLLAKARGAGLLVEIGLGRDGLDHGFPSTDR